MNMRWIWKLFPKTTQNMADEIDRLRFENKQLAYALSDAREQLIKLLQKGIK